MADTKPSPSKDDFHRERSRFLDAFAELEEALLANPGAAKDKQMSNQLQELKAVRNDLVHSHLRFVQLEGELQAVAVNAQQANQPARSARILLLSDFAKLKGKIAQVKAHSAKSASN